MSNVKKVVLAYSGGLDTSAIIPWLKENYDCEVIAFVADVGQGEQELEGIEQKAIASGASQCFVADLKHEMVADLLFTLASKPVPLTRVNTCLVPRWHALSLPKRRSSVP